MRGRLPDLQFAYLKHGPGGFPFFSLLAPTYLSLAFDPRRMYTIHKRSTGMACTAAVRQTDDVSIVDLAGRLTLRRRLLEAARHRPRSDSAGRTTNHFEPSRNHFHRQRWIGGTGRQLREHGSPRRSNQAATCGQQSGRCPAGSKALAGAREFYR